ncbi:helix-turn-helix domain-containing protein [Maribacter chungangensis]|uniref:Helix-turn-helix domain-containing protein n=1 Tax=Maribacter chungangensis TaxID=1069117 RepID=A0ABW3B663_9FLAO
MISTIKEISKFELLNYLSQILFFFGAIGAFNGLIIAFNLILNKSYSKLENRLFGLFLLILSLRVLKSLFYAFSTEEPIWFLQSGPSFFLLIGPLFFSYTLSILKPKSFWIKHWKSHIAIWVCFIVFLMFLVPFKDYHEFYKTIILPIINAQWLVFILISGVFIKLNYKKSLNIKWLSILTIAILIVWTFFTFVSFDYFVGGSIIFSILFYGCFLFFLFKKKIASTIFEKTKLKKNITHSEKSMFLIKKLNSIIIDKKLFTNPELKLSEVAKELGVTNHELSKLINDKLDKNFTELINEYRIEEAKQLIKNNSLYTIEAIGNQSGFNSKSAFYNAFKKVTNTTPAKFKSQL